MYNFISKAFFTILRFSTISLRHELMCFSKIIGSPFVGMELGVEKLYKNMQHEVDFDYDLLVDSVRMTKKNLIKGYILRHKKWPPINEFF